MKKKLKLDLETLAVESFQPGEPGDARGTVLAQSQPTSFPNPCDSDVSVCNMCWWTANPCECNTDW